jgi:hypothetical protein
LLPSTDSFTGLSQVAPPVANAGGAKVHRIRSAPMVPASPSFLPNTFGTIATDV